MDSPDTSHQVCLGTMHSYGNREVVEGLGPSSRGRRPTAAAAVARATCTEALVGTALGIVSRHQQRLGPPGTAAHPLRHTSNRCGGRTRTSDNISVDVGCARMPRSVFEIRGQKNNFRIFFYLTGICYGCFRKVLAQPYWDTYLKSEQHIFCVLFYVIGFYYDTILHCVRFPIILMFSTLL